MEDVIFFVSDRARKALSGIDLSTAKASYTVTGLTRLDLSNIPRFSKDPVVRYCIAPDKVPDVRRATEGD